MVLSFFETSSVVGADGLFIPISDLPGIEASELAAAEPSGKKHSKFLFSLLDKLASNYNATHLGLSIIKGKPSVSGNNVNQSYTITTQSLINFVDNSINVIPVPSAGDNTGIGDFGLVDYLPGVTEVISTDSAGPGVLIPYTELQNYGLHNPPVLGTDDRKVLFSLIAYIVDSPAFAVRNNSPVVQSAIITKSATGNKLAELPAIAYANTNPTTNLLTANKDQQLILQRDYAFVIQLSLSALSTEVNYV